MACLFWAIQGGHCHKDLHCGDKTNNCVGMSTVGPYSRRSRLDKLDRRTAEARFMRDVRAELTAHVGGNPSATQAAMIDRAAWLRLHLRTMDNRTAENRSMSEPDTRTYLAWTGALRRVMDALGPAVPPPSERKPDLRQHLANRAATLPP